MKLMLLILLFVSGCAGVPFKSYKGLANVCHDPYKRESCMRTQEDYDNTSLHKHDSREFESIEVPVR